MIVYYHNLLASVSKWLLKNHSSRMYMHFMVFCTLQKVNVRVALCIINKSGQDHPLATVKMFYFGQEILQAGTQQGEYICVTNFSYGFFFSFFLLGIHQSFHPWTDATCSTSVLCEVEDITHVIGVSFQRGSSLVMQS